MLYWRCQFPYKPSSTSVQSDTVAITPTKVTLDLMVTVISTTRTDHTNDQTVSEVATTEASIFTQTVMVAYTRTKATIATIESVAITHPKANTFVPTVPAVITTIPANPRTAHL